MTLFPPGQHAQAGRACRLAVTGNSPMAFELLPDALVRHDVAAHGGPLDLAEQSVLAASQRRADAIAAEGRIPRPSPNTCREHALASTFAGCLWLTQVEGAHRACRPARRGCAPPLRWPARAPGPACARAPPRTACTAAPHRRGLGLNVRARATLNRQVNTLEVTSATAISAMAAAAPDCAASSARGRPAQPTGRARIGSP